MGLFDLFKRRKTVFLDEIYEEGIWTDILANSEDMASAKETFACYLAAKQNPNQALMKVKKYITKRFEDDLDGIIKNGRDDNMMLGLMGYSSIADNVRCFKSDNKLRYLSGLNKLNYDRLVDSIAQKVSNKYFE